MLHRGEILANKYKILELIGKGGMSRVWQAKDTHVNRDWAVKEINKSSKEYQNTVNEQETLREIEVMKKLDHPSLPRIVDIIDTQEFLYIVMDYIQGETLYEIVKTRGVPEQETVVSWMLDICDTLNYLHHLDPPIIYRDMKPSNIILTPDQRIKVIDLGIAREFKAGMQDTQPLGTRGYASPEHYDMHTDARSDVYTVGTTMYHLLTGKDPSQPPYYMKPIREIDPGLSSGLEKIVLKATASDPDDRYQDMGELANALESYRSLEQEHIDYLERQEKRFRQGIIAGSALMLAGLIFIAAGLIITGRTYAGLIGTTPGTAVAAENYTKAIYLEPGREDAYIKLLSEYTGNGELSEKELNDFIAVYEANKAALSRNEKKYSSVNYTIGENILTYYSGPGDTSARAKLLLAEPFFAEVLTGDDVALASSYVSLAEFYRNYIMADSTLVVKGATSENYKQLIESCQRTLDSLQGETFSGRSRMKDITYEFILTIIDTQSHAMHEASIDEKDVAGIVDRITNDPECSEDNLALADEALKSIKRGYSEKNSREVTYDDAS